MIVISHASFAGYGGENGYSSGGSSGVSIIQVNFDFGDEENSHYLGVI